MPITFSTKDTGDETELHIGGSLDAMTAPELMPTIDKLVEDKTQRVAVHLEGLDLIDSSGVAAIVALYKRIRAQGGRVAVVGARDQPLQIFKLLRMDRVFQL